MLFNQVNTDEFLNKLWLDTSYFLEFSPCNIIGSKAQQYASVFVEISSNISDHSNHTSSSNDATPFNVASENKEHDRKRRKLDHLIDSAGDGSSGGAGGGVRRRGQFLVEPPEFSSIDWNSIDFIFITNYNHMLTLPYVTEYTDLKGNIYAMEPTVLFGR